MEITKRDYVKLVGCVAWCISYAMMTYHAFQNKSCAWPMESSTLTITWEFLNGMLPLLLSIVHRTTSEQKGDQTKPEITFSTWLNAFWFLFHVPLAATILLFGNDGAAAVNSAEYSLQVLERTTEYFKYVALWGLLQALIPGKFSKYVFGWLIVVAFPYYMLQHLTIPMLVERLLMLIGNLCYVGSYWFASSQVPVSVTQQGLLKVFMLATALETTFVVVFPNGIQA
eukprot:TRINITY_DN14119_c0_g1_i1.p1 TRINITY_DN14119_c0_g1~~TRINITY_DN14119_c0_g1_i1.p1  ORF type:complete len:239 (-),score=29.98 TRINITY_DN14119_c0_g1_i1:74-754(-)